MYTWHHMIEASCWRPSPKTFFGLVTCETFQTTCLTDLCLPRTSSSSSPWLVNYSSFAWEQKWMASSPSSSRLWRRRRRPWSTIAPSSPTTWRTSTSQRPCPRVPSSWRLSTPGRRDGLMMKAMAMVSRLLLLQFRRPWRHQWRAPIAAACGGCPSWSLRRSPPAMSGGSGTVGAAMSVSDHECGLVHGDGCTVWMAIQ